MTRPRWAGPLSLHVVALLLYSAIHTTANWLSREVLFRLAGLGDYDYGVMAVRYAMELPIDIILYTAIVVGTWTVDWRNAARQTAFDSERLEARLAQARLQNLQLRLHPHFLFNALNTISSVMYQDPVAADTMLARLSELLRHALRTAEVQEVPLAVELEALDYYLALLEARFGADFTCRRDVDATTIAGLVPSLVLQPLVENAVRHGGLAHSGRGRVALQVRRDADRLVIQVDDDGPGTADDRDVLHEGTGLGATAERLRLLYGDAHTVAAGNLDGGGFRGDPHVAVARGRRLGCRGRAAGDGGGRGGGRAGDAACACSSLTTNGPPAPNCAACSRPRPTSRSSARRRRDAAVDAIDVADPDLVFLDVQMPGMDGFGVLKAVGAARRTSSSRPPTTNMPFGHSKCMRADYLLKPFAPDRFHAVLHRVRAGVARGRAAVPRQHIGEAAAAADQPRLTRLLVHDGDRAYLVPAARIDLIEAAGNHVQVHADGRAFVLRGTLAEFAARLGDDFLQISRSAVVRLDAVRELRPWSHGDYRVVMHDGRLLMWSRRYRARSRLAFEPGVMPGESSRR